MTPCMHPVASKLGRHGLKSSVSAERKVVGYLD
jgi:hypothetical protein